MATTGPGLDVSGTLFIGDVNTTSVVIGKERAVVIDNTTVPPTVSIPSLVISTILTVLALTVTGLSTLATLVVTGASTLASLAVTGASTFTGPLSAAGGVLSDVYANYTLGHTVTLQTTGGNANVLLSPNGSGSVVVASGRTLTADTLGSTTAATSLTLAPTGAFVEITAGKSLAVDSIGPTSAGPTPFSIFGSTNGNIDIVPNGTGLVVFPGVTADDTSTQLLALNGTNGLVFQDTAAGVFASTWTSIAGFTVPPIGTPISSNNAVNFLRLGNMVYCTATIGFGVEPLTTAIGTNTATMTLPIARPLTNFVAPIDVSGTFSTQFPGSAVTSGNLSAVTTTNNTMEISINMPAPGSGGISLSFSYPLVIG
jgi:hypothetical protein